MLFHSTRFTCVYVCVWGVTHNDRCKQSQQLQYQLLQRKCNQLYIASLRAHSYTMWHFVWMTCFHEASLFYVRHCWKLSRCKRKKKGLLKRVLWLRFPGRAQKTLFILNLCWFLDGNILTFTKPSRQIKWMTLAVIVYLSTGFEPTQRGIDVSAFRPTSFL